MSSIRNIIHVGLCKTGTTFLQQNILSKHSGIHYLGKVVSDNEDLLKAGQKIVRQNSIQFRLADVQPVFEAEFAKTRPGQVRVLSEEDLTTYKFIDPGLCAMRLRQIFGDARILLTIREPRGWLESLYFFRLWVGQPDVMQPFPDWLRWALGQPHVLNPVTEIHFANIARLYEETFGRDNVLVIPYERLREDATGYITTIADFMGVDAAEMLALNNAREGKTKEKSRMSQREAEFHQLLKLLANGDLAGFAAGLAPWVEQAAEAQRAALSSRLDALRGSSEDQKEWRQLFNDLRVALRARFADSPPATPEWPPALMNRLQTLLGPGIRQLSDSRGLDLARFGYPLA